MSNNLPEGAYTLENGKFSLTEKFDKYAAAQGLDAKTIQSLRTELEKFYGPGKKLSALEPFMKKTIERKTEEAKDILKRDSRALGGIEVPGKIETTVPEAQLKPTSSVNNNPLLTIADNTNAGKNFRKAFGDPMRGHNDI